MAQVIGNEMVEEVVESQADAQVQATETPADAPAETPKETTKRDPLAKYKELSEENQATVDEIVADVIGKIGGEDNIDLAMLLGILDKLNAEKKTAREVEKQKEKERKAAAKDAQVVLAKKIADEKLVKELDKIDYFMSTSKVTILQAEVIKVTDKSARIDVVATSKVLYKGKEMTAQEAIMAGAGLKLGKKSVAFGKIANLTRNGEAIDLAA
jgi:ABC-type lipoprotein release transport system permease subunit